MSLTPERNSSPVSIITIIDFFFFFESFRGVNNTPLNPSDTSPIIYNLSNIKPQIPNLSDIEPIRQWTYQVENIFGTGLTELVRFWTDTHCGKNFRIFQDAADQTLPVTEFSEIYIWIIKFSYLSRNIPLQVTYGLLHLGKSGTFRHSVDTEPIRYWACQIRDTIPIWHHIFWNWA